MGDAEMPVVSVCCTCYNHERYIAKALQSFVNQETSFKYEIIVHDDASTDSSAQIIRGFVEKYPTLVFPIYQKENQYSKKVKITQDILVPKARGKYIALCEGDDFWCDPDKLQLQFDYMESHPECYMCAHANLEVSESGKYHGQRRYSDHDAEVPVSDCFGNPPVHLSSYFIRKELFRRFSPIKSLCPVGDVSLCVEAAMIHPIHYINRPMSCYRISSVSSWSRRMSASSKMREDHYLRTVEYFKAMSTLLPQCKKRIAEAIENTETKVKLERMGRSGEFVSDELGSQSWLKIQRWRLRINHKRLYSVIRLPVVALRAMKRSLEGIRYRELIK